MRALARRPEDRYPSAADLRDEIRRFRANEPVDSMPEGRSVYGCVHMSGNVKEWTCSEGHGDQTHIEKGGELASGQGGLELSDRDSESDENSDFARGFRLVVSYR